MQFSWTKTSEIRGKVTGMRLMVPMGAYTGSFVRLRIRRWCYLGSAEYLLAKGINPQMTKELTVTGKWTLVGNRNVFIAGKIKAGDKELKVRDKEGKLIRK